MSEVQIERRRPFVVDQEKFSTQRTVTYTLLLIFAAVSGWVLWQNDQSERSMVLQTVINLTLLAVGYWLGTSKQGAEQALSVSRMAEVAAPRTNGIMTPKVDVVADTATVTEKDKP